ncbi:response regulator transcription factor [Paenibacillus sp. 1001270B_150601_E10]|uniref:response regulator transcription factor n=1 Tax=Paenibacillus sp. 1001270B_150601_E10 TaxID=2787079 RepID=UPI00189EEC0F|nr:response regulator transcription factor [Paenibacillus sp. 1001270B_150601_E10]
MSQHQILLVDDEWNMRNLLRIYFKKAGFAIKEASTGYEALSIIQQHSVDVVILDIMMPGMDGWEVCRAIREQTTVPILMLTARSDTQDKVHGLEIGADDYVTKPFEPEELVARVNALVRRSSISQAAKEDSDLLTYPQLRIDPDAREVYVQEEKVEFTPKEFDLLYLVAKHPQRAFQREDLVLRLWGYEYSGDSRVVDTHVKNIREKLHRAGLDYSPIQTVWGVGYKFHAQGAST